MIERLVVALVVGIAALWAFGWLLAHLGLIFVAALGLAAWAWWRARRRA